MKVNNKLLRTFLKNIREYTPAAGGVFCATIAQMGNKFSIFYPAMGGISIEFSCPAETENKTDFIGICPLASHEWERFIEIATKSKTLVFDRNKDILKVGGESLKLAPQPSAKVMTLENRLERCSLGIKMSDLCALGHFGQDIDFYVNAPIVFATGVSRDIIHYHAIVAAATGKGKFNLPTSFLLTVRKVSKSIHDGNVNLTYLSVDLDYVAQATIKQGDTEIRMVCDTVETKFEGIAAIRGDLDQAVKRRYSWHLSGYELSGVLLRIMSKLPKEPTLEQCLVTLSFANRELVVKHFDGEEKLAAKGRGRGEITVDLASMFEALGALGSQDDLWLFPKPPKTMPDFEDINCLVMVGWGTLTYVGGIEPSPDPVKLPTHRKSKDAGKELIVDWGNFEVIQSEYVKNRPTLTEALEAQEMAMAIMPVDEYDYEGRMAVAVLEQSHQALLRAIELSLKKGDVPEQNQEFITKLALECEQILNDPYVHECLEDIGRIVSEALNVTRMIECYVTHAPKLVRTEFRYQGMKVSYF